MSEEPTSLEQAVSAASGLVLLMGATDTGKSTLAARLGSLAAGAGRKAALVDLDPGQSEVGPPGLLDLVEAAPDVPMAKWKARAHWYLGAAHPFAAMPQMVSGARRLADKALEQGYGPVVVDTPSFVPHLRGLALATALLDVLRPEMTVVIQWDAEMERWLRGTGAAPVRLAADPAVRSKPVGLRSARRATRLGAYFRDASEHAIRLTEMPLRGTRLGAGYPLPRGECAQAAAMLGRPVLHGERAASSVAFWTDGPPIHAPQRVAATFGAVNAVAFDANLWKNRSVGFIGADGRCLAMGLMEDVDWPALTARVLAPIYSVADAVAMSLGVMRHNPDGDELPPVPERDA